MEGCPGNKSGPAVHKLQVIVVWLSKMTKDDDLDSEILFKFDLDSFGPFEHLGFFKKMWKARKFSVAGSPNC